MKIKLKPGAERKTPPTIVSFLNFVVKRAEHVNARMTIGTSKMNHRKIANGLARISMHDAGKLVLRRTVLRRVDYLVARTTPPTVQVVMINVAVPGCHRTPQSDASNHGWIQSIALRHVVGAYLDENL